MLHPMVIHLPLGLMFLAPIIIFLLWQKVKENADQDLSQNDLWRVLIVVLLIMTIASFVSMMTGEHDEEIVEKLVPEEPIESHEDIAKIFTISVVILLAGSVAIAYLKENIRNLMIISLLGLSLVVIALGGLTGKKGGELVYQHKAANAFDAKTVGDNAQPKKNEKHDKDDDDD